LIGAIAGVGLIGAIAGNFGAGCGCRDDSAPAPNLSAASQEVTSCSCYNRTSPVTGATGRLFVDSSNEDFVVVEDPATRDAYRWSQSGTSWLRIGGAARSYAAGRDAQLNSVLYRLAGDARVDVKAATTCSTGSNAGRACHQVSDCPGGACVATYDEFTPGGAWLRLGAPVARDLLVSASAPYLFGPLNNNPAQYALVKSPGLGTGTQIDTVNGAEIATTAYAPDSSGGALLYKKSSTATLVYNGAWSQIGNTAVSSIFSAASTLFAITPGGAVQEYLGTPLQWATTTGATGITRVTGNATVAYALASGTVYQLSGTAWAPVAGITGVADIAAGPTHLYALKTDGSVLQLGSAWTDISCTGAVSATGCAGTGLAGSGCEPGPIASGAAPGYTDGAKTTQDSPANTRYDVVTQHNDNARTGAATSEDILTPASLTSGGFGWRGSVKVPGKIYAQPLYIEKAAVVCTSPHTPGLQNANIAYVATLENEVLAIDVDAMQVCWSTAALGCPQTTYGHDTVTNCGAATGVALDGACSGNFDAGKHHEGGAPGVRIGIVSTPVIDRAHDVMYVMTRTRDGDDMRGRYVLNVLDTRTGQLVAHVEAIADTLNGRNDCGGHAFHPSQGTQRTGLLLQNNVLYAAFSANSGENNNADYHGHVLGFDVSNPANPTNLNSSFCATPTSTGGGIWMAGGGLAGDGTSAYFSTGNGAYAAGDPCGEPQTLAAIPEQPPAGNFPDSFVKLSSGMAGTGYTDTRAGVTGFDIFHCPLPTCGGCDASHLCLATGASCVQHSMFWARERSDADFGSGGVMLAGNRLIGGGKDGHLYVIDRATMTRQQDFQAFLNTYEPSSTFHYDTPWYYGPHIHGTPVAFDAGGSDIYVYAWSEKDHLKRFRFSKSTNVFEAADAVDASAGNPFPTARGELASPAGPGGGANPITAAAMPGGMLSLSASGTDSSTAIVWATVEEPYKFCTKLQQPDGSWKVVVDQPVLASGDDIPGCDVLGGYTPGRLYAFAAEPDAQNRLKLLWGDTSAPPIPSAAPQPPGVEPPARSPNNFIPGYAKHAPPTIAHGKVLIATANTDSDGNAELRIYGLGSTHGPQTATPVVDAIAVTPPPGATGVTQLPLAAATTPAGSFNVTLDPQGTFATWAATCTQRWDGVWTHASALVGDFNGDGWADIALTGAANFTLLKMALSSGNGSFTVQQWAPDNSSFNGWATSTTATMIVGNFGDGNAIGGKDAYADIALVGDPGFCTIPVAFGRPATGGFKVTNLSAGQFTGGCSPITGGWAAVAGARLAGDFDGDGLTDIALMPVAGSGWHTIPIAFSLGDGTFSVTNREVGGAAPFDTALPLWPNTGAPYSQFAMWATSLDVNNKPVSALVGDFNGDGRSDIALVGGSGWYTVPVAFSSGDGSFRVTNRCAAPSANCTADSVIDFAGTASRVPRAELRVIGDFNGDGRTDLAVLDASNSASPITVAFSNGDGSFRFTQRAAGLSSFAGWLSLGARPVVGDFDHDGAADIALVGVSGWTTIPVALSNGDGTFRLVNAGGAPNMGAFETAAASTATCNGVAFPATLLRGRFR
jgi:hypothetical protein